MCKIFENYVRMVHAIHPVIYYIAGTQTLKISVKLIQIYNSAQIIISIVI